MGMPRKPLDRQHRGRYVNRYLSGINNFRKYTAEQAASYPARYWTLEPNIDHAVIRNPDMKPLLHRGRKP